MKKVGMWNMKAMVSSIANMCHSIAYAHSFPNKPSAYRFHWQEQLKFKSSKLAQSRFNESEFMLTCQPCCQSYCHCCYGSCCCRRRFESNCFSFGASASLDIIIIITVVALVVVFVRRFRNHTRWYISLHQKCSCSLFINGMASRNAHKRLHIACAYCVLCHSLLE